MLRQGEETAARCYVFYEYIRHTEYLYCSAYLYVRTKANRLGESQGYLFYFQIT